MYGAITTAAVFCMLFVMRRVKSRSERGILTSPRNIFLNTKKVGFESLNVCRSAFVPLAPSPVARCCAVESTSAAAGLEPKPRFYTQRDKT